MEIISTPHDSFMKNVLKNRKVAIDLLQQYLPEKLLAELAIDTLRPVDKSFVDEQLRQSHADMLFEVEMREKPAYVYCLIEHQRKPDPLLPWRIKRYIARIIDTYKVTKPEVVLPFVYPLVLYNGIAPYNYSMDYLDLFGDNCGLAREIYTKPYQLINLANIPLPQQYTWSARLVIPLKLYDEFTVAHATQIAEVVMQTMDSDSSNFCIACVNYLLNGQRSLDMEAKKHFIGDIAQQLPFNLDELDPDDRYIIEYFIELCTEKAREGLRRAAHKKGLTQGIEQGIEQGLEQGKQAAKHEIARKLLHGGMPIAQVAKMLDMSVLSLEQAATVN